MALYYPIDVGAVPQLEEKCVFQTASVLALT